jgi:hypothetical protein
VRRAAVVLSTIVSMLVLAEPAVAVAPTLASVGQANRHPNASFSAPKASDVTMYVAKKADRATDGSFLSENITSVDVLTDSEIQSGRWESEDQLDPGTYYVMLRASPDFDACYIIDTGEYDPSCADGYSNVVPLTIPTPTIRYRASATVLRYIGQVTLRLTAAPLGARLPYRVCYPLRTGKRRCLAGAVEGYDWNSSATDTLTASMRGLGKRTTFTWFVNGRKVAAQVVRTA